MSTDTPAPPPATTATNIPAAASSRLMSLDALRGFDMLWIIGADSLVNALKAMNSNPLINFLAAQLTHKDWEGFAFEDLIFPLFVFMAGVSLVFSLDKAIATEGPLAAVKRVLRRGLLLYALGVIYYGGFTNEWERIRWVGVLHRIAIASCFAGLIYCCFRLRGMIIICAGILIGYWAMMTFIPVPGHGAGNFAEGANLANYIDSEYLPGRRWDGKWDPEGLLSNIPAIATCLLGIFAGLLLKSRALDERRKVAWLMGGGAALVALGFLWGLQFPVIKKLWTSSYVLVAGGYSAMLLGLFYLVIDVEKKQRWCIPFIWIGTNSIVIYMIENVVNYEKFAGRFLGGPIERFFNEHVTKGFGNLLLACLALAFAFILGRFLYNRKIFIRV